MTPRAYCFMKPAIIILVLCILAAGCTSAPCGQTCANFPAYTVYDKSSHSSPGTTGYGFG